MASGVDTKSRRVDRPASDGINEQIIGDDMHIVEIELDPGETVIVEAGAMNYLDEDISLEWAMGDGTTPPEGFWDQRAARASACWRASRCS
jgi:uncharacterized protein (AIM24 family)